MQFLSQLISAQIKLTRKPDWESVGILEGQYVHIFHLLTSGNLEQSAMSRHVHYKVLALEEIFKKGFPCNIIERRPQEIYLNLEENVGRKYPGPKVERKLEENIP